MRDVLPDVLPDVLSDVLPDAASGTGDMPEDHKPAMEFRYWEGVMPSNFLNCLIK